MEKCFISSTIEKLAVYDQPDRTVVEQKRGFTYIYVLCTLRNEIRTIFTAIRLTVKLYSLYKRIVYLMVGTQPRDSCSGLFIVIHIFISELHHK
jgi:hypothetical protein